MSLSFRLSVATSDQWSQTPDPEMTDSKMDEVKIDRMLKSKTKFGSWKREFERAAKTHGILEYLVACAMRLISNLVPFKRGKCADNQAV